MEWTRDDDDGGCRRGNFLTGEATRERDGPTCDLPDPGAGGRDPQVALFCIGSSHAAVGIFVLLYYYTAYSGF